MADFELHAGSVELELPWLDLVESDAEVFERTGIAYSDVRDVSGQAKLRTRQAVIQALDDIVDFLGETDPSFLGWFVPQIIRSPDEKRGTNKDPYLIDYMKFPGSTKHRCLLPASSNTYWGTGSFLHGDQLLEIYRDDTIGRVVPHEVGHAFFGRWEKGLLRLPQREDLSLAFSFLRKKARIFIKQGASQDQVMQAMGLRSSYALFTNTRPAKDRYFYLEPGYIGFIDDYQKLSPEDFAAKKAQGIEVIDQCQLLRLDTEEAFAETFAALVSGRNIHVHPSMFPWYQLIGEQLESLTGVDFLQNVYLMNPIHPQHL